MDGMEADQRETGELDGGSRGLDDQVWGGGSYTGDENMVSGEARRATGWASGWASGQGEIYTAKSESATGKSESATGQSESATGQSSHTLRQHPTREKTISHIAFTDLPTELLIQIFSHLDPASLRRIALVCRSWNKLASDNAVWCQIFQARFHRVGATFSSLARTPAWRTELIYRESLVKTWRRGRSTRRTYSLAQGLAQTSNLFADFARDRLVAFDANSGRLLGCHLDSGHGASAALCAIPGGTTAYAAGPHFLLFGRWDGSVYGSLVDHRNILLVGLHELGHGGPHHLAMVTAAHVCSGDIGKAGTVGAFTGDQEGRVLGWDVRTGECVMDIPPPSDPALSDGGGMETDSVIQEEEVVPTGATTGSSISPLPPSPALSAAASAPTSALAAASSATIPLSSAGSSLSVATTPASIPSSRLSPITRMDSDGHSLLILNSLGHLWYVSLSQLQSIPSYICTFDTPLTATSISTNMLVDYGGENVVLYDDRRLEIHSFNSSSISVLHLDPGEQIYRAALEDNNHRFLKQNDRIVGKDPLLMAILLRSGRVLIVNVRERQFHIIPITSFFPQMISEMVPDNTPPISAITLNALVVLVGSRDGQVEMYDVMTGEFCRKVSERLGKKLLISVGRAEPIPVSNIIVDEKLAVGVITYGPIVQFFKFGDFYRDLERKSRKKAFSKDRKGTTDELRIRMDDYQYQLDEENSAYDLVAKYNGDSSENPDEEMQMALALSVSMENSRDNSRYGGEEGPAEDEELRKAIELSEREQREKKSVDEELRRAIELSREGRKEDDSVDEELRRAIELSREEYRRESKRQYEPEEEEEEEDDEEEEEEDDEDMKLAMRLSLMGRPGEGSSEANYRT
ncbi:DEKNAAC102526 [Brettanomyces naardenensis]|uniref:DEKNAAC102526 n=1 Tax=Brettanomyces naardenensis TaxID=13370 RepID=A0A448YLK7_BRENA|nr:DEKNAAC102526 [Brettanomyces naardenensis]